MNTDLLYQDYLKVSMELLVVPVSQAEAPFILALDVGSSSLRAVLFDRWGRSVEGVEARRPHVLTFGSDGEASADPDALVDLLADCIDSALFAAGPLAAGIAAVAGCSLAGTLLGVDETGCPVTPLITYADTRAASEAAALRAELDEPYFHQRTGTRFHPSYWPAQLRWLQRNRPELFSQVARWMTWGEYLETRLFGQGATSLSAASWSGLLHRERVDWDPQLVAALPVTSAQLPQLVDLSTPRRGLCREFALRWPALRDAPWFPMIGDGAAANIGSGCTSPGRVALTVGTTTALRAVVTDPTIPLPNGLWCYRVDSRRLLPGGALTEGGGVFAWLRQTLRLGESAQLETTLARGEPDAHGLTVLPFFAGERSPGWDGDARASIHGLSLATTPEDILRAGLEAVALRITLVYNELRGFLPAEPQVIAGGGALLSSPAWQQIIADALGVPIAISAISEASARGAALLALEAMGVLPDAGQTPDGVGATVMPNLEHHRRYQGALERQQRLYAQLAADR